MFIFTPKLKGQGEEKLGMNIMIKNGKYEG